MKMQKIVCLIPARGGSKGIPGKNIKPFGGKPLLCHSIEYAASVNSISSIYVSTDDENIERTALHSGATVIKRPESISGDHSTTEETIDHFLNQLSFESSPPDIIVLLQATSPFRPAHALHEALEHFTNHEFDTLVTISPTHRFFWHIEDQIAVPEYDFLNRPMRQDITKEDTHYVENGSFYIFTYEHFMNSGNRLGGKIGYMIFPEEYSLEIDSLQDWNILEQIVLAQKNKNG